MKDRWGDVCGDIVVLEPQATTSTSARIRLFVVEGIEGLWSDVQILFEKHLFGIKNGG